MRTALLAALAAGLTAGAARADEGMWTFDAFPSAKVKADYGVTIDKPWLDRLQRASVRLTDGCSASVVSDEGLMLTNHHCVVDCVQNLSSAQTDYVQSGFLTSTRGEEKRCPGQQAEILEEIVDVTPKLLAATRGKSGEAFVRARDAAAARIEDEACARKKRQRCQVIDFYHGGEFKLYRYQAYDDVRLVFAPEFGIAFFGGDPDNFNFPRYNLDSAFLRLYEDGAPARTPFHLRWLTRAPTPGEPVFVAGNPGSTQRLLTMAELQTQRNLAIPVSQLQRSELRGRLIRFAEESAEHARLAQDQLFFAENAFKVYYGRQMALNDAAFMGRKQAEEDALRAKVAGDPKLAAQFGDPWAAIGKAQEPYAEHYLRYRQLESAAGASSDLFAYARKLVRAGLEREKPSAARLPEYGDARLALLEKQLTDPQPVDPELETLFLSFWLSKTREYLTADDPAVTGLLGKDSPEALAARLVEGTRLGDPAVRKALWKGGAAKIRTSDDPLIRFVLRTDPAARAIRRTWEDEVAGPIDRASEDVARARFAAVGEGTYPDATFSLRLSYGKIDGWSRGGTTVPPTTDFAGLYRRATGSPPYALPQRWIEAQDRLAPETVYNVSTTNDVVGGNSGSPLVDANGDVLGAVFDGNIHSLGGDYGYDPELNRTVAVTSAAITEALRTVYGRTALVQELTGR